MTVGYWAWYKPFRRTLCRTVSETIIFEHFVISWLSFYRRQLYWHFIHDSRVVGRKCVVEMQVAGTISCNFRACLNSCLKFRISNVRYLQHLARRNIKVRRDRSCSFPVAKKLTLFIFLANEYQSSKTRWQKQKSWSEFIDHMTLYPKDGFPQGEPFKASTSSILTSYLPVFSFNSETNIIREFLNEW